tara:strand:- start:207 stop:503 length:297 start_codon:yes stop_codon:yes gene_type:complete
MTFWSDTMLHNKHLKTTAAGSTGIIADTVNFAKSLVPLPKRGKTGQWYLGAAMIYVALGAPGSKRVIREIASIIDQPKYFAKVVTGGAGALLVFSAAS